MLQVYTDLAPNEPVPNPGPPSSIWRTDAHLEVIGQSTGQWLFVGTENKLLIEQIFGALDANKDGNINVNDFRPAAERPARSELWDVLRTHFDGDSNGVISLDEFVDLFKKRALTLSCVPFRSAPTDHSNAMEYLNVSINRQLKKELSRFQRRVGRFQRRVGPPQAPAAAFESRTSLQRMAELNDDDLVDYEEDEAAEESKPQDEVKKGGTYSGIHASGFRDFLLKPELLRAVVDCGFEHPSEVQYECIPQAILGMDVLCQAKSGMGKTAVFVLSTLHQLETKEESVGALVCACVRHSIHARSARSTAQ